MYNVRHVVMLATVSCYAFGAVTDISQDKRIAVRQQLAECLKPVTGEANLKQQGTIAADIYAARNNHGDVRLRVAMQADIGKITNPVVIDALIERLSMQKFYAQSVELASAFESPEIKAKFVRPAIARLQYYIKQGNGKEIADLYFEAFYNSSFRKDAQKELAKIDAVEGRIPGKIERDVLDSLRKINSRNAQFAANELESLFFPSQYSHPSRELVVIGVAAGLFGVWLTR